MMHHFNFRCSYLAALVATYQNVHHHYFKLNTSYCAYIIIVIAYFVCFIYNFITYR